MLDQDGFSAWLQPPDRLACATASQDLIPVLAGLVPNLNYLSFYVHIPYILYRDEYPELYRICDDPLTLVNCNSDAPQERYYLVHIRCHVYINFM
jgi:hypothetical protein